MVVKQTTYQSVVTEKKQSFSISHDSVGWLNPAEVIHLAPVSRWLD